MTARPVETPIEMSPERPIEAPTDTSIKAARIVRATHFSCAYSYGSLLGRWAARDGLGCNFRVECAFRGPIDPLTGMVLNLAEVDAWLKAAALEFDHRDLTGLPRFRGGLATADALACAFHEAVREQMPVSRRSMLESTRVCEGSSTWAEWIGHQTPT